MKAAGITEPDPATVVTSGAAVGAAPGRPVILRFSGIAVAPASP